MHPLVDHYVAERTRGDRLAHVRLIAGEYHRVGAPSSTLGLIAAFAGAMEGVAHRIRHWAQGPVATEQARTARPATGR